MITIEPTTDRELIKSVRLADDLYDLYYVDGMVPKEQWEPEISPFHMWLLIKVGKKVAGVLEVKQLTNISAEVHIAILKKYRQHKELCGKQLKDWLFTYTKMKHFMAAVPDCHSHVKRYMHLLGFWHICGVMHKAVSIHDHIYDVILYEVL